MLWRVQCTFQMFSWLVVLPLAFALVACGGSPDRDGVTGSSVATLSEDSGTSDTLSASKKKPKTAKVLICHNGRDKKVPPTGLSAHLGHGDSLGSCSAPEACPCFSAPDIQAAGTRCSSAPTATCSTAEPYYLFLGCAPGGDVPASPLGIYLSQTSNGGYCHRDDVRGTFEQTGLTDTEYQACVSAIDDSGFCS